MYVDTHAHLDMKPFEDDLDDVLDRARSADVLKVITVGSDLGSSAKAIEIAHRYDMVYATAGVHPHEVSEDSSIDLGALESLLGERKVVALGEIGLDYFYEHAPRDAQRKAFQEQIELACSTQKPIIVHVREAHEDAVDILRSTIAGDTRGVIHCYTGNPEYVADYLDMGFFISFTGILTFKKALDIREAALRTPLNRIMIETDAPYLAPIPHRGKRNEPAFVVETARKLAEIKGIPVDEVAIHTTRNAATLFGVGSED